jgi:hypothetical protein
MASDSMGQLAHLMKGITSTAHTASRAFTKGGRKRKSTTKVATKKTRKGRRHRRVKKSRVNWFF